MAHFQQQAFVKAVKAQYPGFFTDAKVLEVGSWNVTGTVRDHFRSCDYTGTDIAAGTGVDLAVPGQKLDFPDDTFDTVISCECFEHNPFWRETFLNMARMLRPGGLFVFTCAGVGRGEHGTRRTDPSASLTAQGNEPDYYHNLSRRDFESGIDLRTLFSQHAFVDNRYAKDLYFVAIKQGGAPDPADATKIAAIGAAARHITIEHGANWLQAVGAHAEWAFKSALARLLGERRYHNLRLVVRPRYFRKRTPPPTPG